MITKNHSRKSRRGRCHAPYSTVGRECSPTTHRVHRHQTYHGRVGTNPTNRQHRLTPASRQNLFMPSKPTTSSSYKGPLNSHSTTSSTSTCSDALVSITTPTPTVHYNRITASSNHNGNPMSYTTTILNTHHQAAAAAAPNQQHSA